MAWREQSDTEVLAIFQLQVENDNLNPNHDPNRNSIPESCNWLMHYGFGLNISPGRWRWAKTVLDWNVNDMSVLKNLFHGAGHALSILEMPKADAVRLYCRDKTDDCSNEEYNLFSPILTL